MLESGSTHWKLCSNESPVIFKHSDGKKLAELGYFVLYRGLNFGDFCESRLSTIPDTMLEGLVAT